MTTRKQNQRSFKGSRNLILGLQTVKGLKRAGSISRAHNQGSRVAESRDHVKKSRDEPRVT